MMRSMFAAVLLGAAAASAADVPQLSFSLGYQTQLYTSRGYDLVDVDDNLPMFRLATGTGIPVLRGTLDVEAAFSTGTSRESAHGSVPVELWLRGVEVGATYRYPLVRFLEPYAHLAVGWDWATLQLLNESRLSQTVSHISGQGLVGLQMPIRLGNALARRLVLVLDLGGGYVLRPDYAFTAMAAAAAPPSPDPVARGAVNVGSLSMHGGVIRALISLRY